MKNLYRQLTLKQRYQIQAYLKVELSLQGIADNVGCNKSSISRELKRCKPGRYCAETAHNSSINKRKKAKKFTKKTDAAIKAIGDLLEKKYSPRAIAGRMQLEQCSERVSHETIYQWAYQMKSLGGDWHQYLLRAKRGYRKKRKASSISGLAPDRISIDLRGKAANDRIHRGHWEGDTVHGSSGNLVTVIDRKTRYLEARKTERRGKDEVGKKLCEMLSMHTARTITVDNGREFYGHADITEKTGIKVYFADPYASWQKGSIEHANGLLRRYFPKGTDFTKVSAQKLRRVVEKINMMPREILGWKSAFEVHHGVSVALIT